MNYSKTYYGENSKGYKAIEKDIRLLSTLEVNAIAESFSEKSGLDREQFAVNGWGFPFIPKVFLQDRFGRKRMAPPNVKRLFLGHPIYWIEPHLTALNPGESEQEWCVRMFLLIDSMGYWNEHGQFIDYLKISDFSENKSQLKVYRNIAQEAETDSFGLLDEKDMNIPFSDIEKQYLEIIEKCFSMQYKASVEMLQSQARNYKFAKKALGKDVRKWALRYDNPGDVWDRAFMPKLTSIAEEFNERARQGNTIVSDLYIKLEEVQSKVEEVSDRYHHAASILEMPIKASIEGRPGGASRIALIASYMSDAIKRDNLRKVLYSKMTNSIEESFSGSMPQEGDLDKVIHVMADIYEIAWSRMRLAFINFDNLRDGNEVFASAIEMQTSLKPGSDAPVIINNDERSTLHSILEEEF